MKKIAMWAFIFTALTASTYMTLSTATSNGVIEAYAKERTPVATQYYAVFDKLVRERVQHRWYAYTRVTRQYEVCEVSKQTATELRDSHKTTAIGKSKNRATFVKVKKRYADEVRAGIPDRKCVTVKRPWWYWFVFNGGGHVS